MVATVFATKVSMSQAWTDAGKRLPVTRCQVKDNVVIRTQVLDQDSQVLDVGYGDKKLKNVAKPIRAQLEKNGYKAGVAKIEGVTVSSEVDATALIGKTLVLDEVLSVGDIVSVQGISKGRGFAGAIKRHGFSGGPKTHGQSDRERAVGSIGAGTSPGKVWKGKKMPGHYGVDKKTVQNLVVVHIDTANKEVWLSGPVPGAFSSTIRITKTGQTKTITLDSAASGIKSQVAEVAPDSTEQQAV